MPQGAGDVTTRAVAIFSSLPSIGTGTTSIGTRTVVFRLLGGPARVMATAAHTADVTRISESASRLSTASPTMIVPVRGIVA